MIIIIIVVVLLLITVALYTVFINATSGEETMLTFIKDCSVKGYNYDEYVLLCKETDTVPVSIEVYSVNDPSIQVDADAQLKWLNNNCSN